MSEAGTAHRRRRGGRASGSSPGSIAGGGASTADRPAADRLDLSARSRRRRGFALPQGTGVALGPRSSGRRPRERNVARPGSCRASPWAPPTSGARAPRTRPQRRRPASRGSVAWSRTSPDLVQVDAGRRSCRPRRSSRASSWPSSSGSPGCRSGRTSRPGRGRRGTSPGPRPAARASLPVHRDVAVRVARRALTIGRSILSAGRPRGWPCASGGLRRRLRVCGRLDGRGRRRVDRRCRDLDRRRGRFGSTPRSERGFRCPATRRRGAGRRRVHVGEQARR